MDGEKEEYMIINTYILDTNVYGELIIEEGNLELINSIRGDASLNIYGIDVIEKELQDVHSDKKIKGIFFRNAVLNLYKSMIKEEIFLSPLGKYLAGEYSKKYFELRKSGKYYKIVRDKELKFSMKDLEADFEIIAIASLKGIDVVVSADTRTMLSKIASETYEIVNKINGIRTPKLIDYFEFIKRYRK